MADQQPIRLPMMLAPENRDETTGKDARLVNGYIEQVSKEELWLYKRPGMYEYSSSGTAAGRGVYNWRGNIYAIWGSTMYKDGVSLSGTLDTTGGVYTFSECLGATPKLVFQNGVKAYTYDSGSGIVQITDGDYPSSTVKGQAYLDGTTYVMNSAANIYGSDINDPQNWDPLNKLVAQIEPDGGVAVAKQLVYVIAFKQWSVEVFYDAANSTGSPLGTVQGAKVNVGCRHQDSVRELEGTLFWVAEARGGSLSVWMMENLKAQQVSTPAIERLLQQADFTTVYSWTARSAGHKFYVLTLVASNLTLVFDATSRRWYQWTDVDGNYLPIVSATFNTTQQPLLQHASNGKVYRFDLAYANDDGSLITVDLYTPNFDGGTRKVKYLHSMDFVADQTAGSVLQVRCTDDDYQTYSNFRTVDLSLKRPRLTQCGSFRRRAYHLRHACNTPLRVQAVEMQVDPGEL